MCKIGGIKTTAIVDSGSRYNLLDENMWAQLMGIKVSKQQKGSDKVFKSYGGYRLTIIGTFDTKIEISGKQTAAEFYVIKETGKVLLGQDTAMLLGILKIDAEVNNIVEPAKKAFPKMKNIVVDIPIKKDVMPVVQPYRRIPIAMEQVVGEKIKELEELDIIEPVNKPPTWVSPVVVVDKGNTGQLDKKNLRVCIDMRRANEAVERENYPLPTIDDFLPHIGEGKIFSRLDIRNAFHQVRN